MNTVICDLVETYLWVEGLGGPFRCSQGPKSAASDRAFKSREIIKLLSDVDFCEPF